MLKVGVVLCVFEQDEKGNVMLGWDLQEFLLGWRFGLVTIIFKVKTKVKINKKCIKV